MRDDQVRRYARHILLPDVGGLGQTALLGSIARLQLGATEPDAALIAAGYLAAGGVGTLVVTGATTAQLAELAAHGPDTRIVAAPDHRDPPPDPADRELALPSRPAWWPATEGSELALAFWRGGVAAVRWMAGIANP